MDKYAPAARYHGLEIHSPVSSLSSFGSENAGNMSGHRKDYHRLKSSQWRVLAWVAVTRNNNRHIPQEQRCTCPMDGCGQRFHSPELMHMHLKDSICMSGTTYHCFEAGQTVRFGKCACPGCQDLKGRLTTAVSSSIKSIRSIRRRLSKRGSESPRRVHEDPETESASLNDYPIEIDDVNAILKYSELPLTDAMPCAEVAGSSPGPYDTSRQELEGATCSFISELNSIPITYAQPFPPSKPSRNSAQHFNPYTPARSELENQQSTVSHPIDWGWDQTPTLYDYDQSTIHRNSQARFIPELCETRHEQIVLEQQPPPMYSYGQYCFDRVDSMGTAASPSLENNYTAVRPNSDRVVVHEMPSASMYQGQESSYPSSVRGHENLQYSDEMAMGDTSNMSLDCNRLTPREGSGASSVSGHSYHINSSLSSGTFGSSISTSRTSMTSLTSGPQGVAHPVDRSFLGDDTIMSEEPDDMEPSPIPTTSERRRPRNVRSYDRRADVAGVSIDNPANDYQPSVQPHGRKLSTAHPFTSAPHSSPGLLHSTTFNTPPHITASSPMAESPLASLQTPSSSQAISLGKAYCRHCALPCDISNRSRHEKACKQNPDFASTPRIPCHYPGCTSTFGRKDNLAHHQKTRKHFAIGNVEMKMTFTPTPGSPVWDLAMQAFGQKCGESPVEAHGDEFGMDYDGGDVRM